LSDSTLQSVGLLTESNIFWSSKTDSEECLEHPTLNKNRRYGIMIDAKELDLTTKEIAIWALKNRRLEVADHLDLSDEVLDEVLVRLDQEMNPVV